jgi:hypothetical protein
MFSQLEIKHKLNIIFQSYVYYYRIFIYYFPVLRILLQDIYLPSPLLNLSQTSVSPKAVLFTNPILLQRIS